MVPAPQEDGSHGRLEFMAGDPQKGFHLPIGFTQRLGARTRLHLRAPHAQVVQGDRLLAQQHQHQQRPGEQVGHEVMGGEWRRSHRLEFQGGRRQGDEHGQQQAEAFQQVVAPQAQPGLCSSPLDVPALLR